MQGDIGHPVPRRRLLAADRGGNRIDELLDRRHVGLVPVPFHGPPAGLGFLRHRAHQFDLEQRATQRHVLVHAELHELLHAVDLGRAAHVVQQHVGLVGLGLDQRRREVGAGDRQHVALPGAAECGQLLDEVGLQRLAVGIIRRDEEPFLAEALHQLAGDGGGVHRRGVAGAERVPLAILAGDRVGVPARDDVEHLLVAGHAHDRVGDAGVHVAHDDVDVVALDQLVGLLHAGTGIVGAVLDEELDGPAENAALLVHLLDRPLGALDLADRQGGQAAGDRIDEADLHGRLTARLDNEGAGELQAAHRRGSGQELAARRG